MGISGTVRGHIGPWAHRAEYVGTSVRGLIGLSTWTHRSVGTLDWSHLNKASMEVAIVSVLSCANPGIHSKACVQPCVNGVVHNESVFNQTNRALFIVSLCVSHVLVEVFIMSLCFSHAPMAKLIFVLAVRQ